MRALRKITVDGIGSRGRSISIYGIGPSGKKNKKTRVVGWKFRNQKRVSDPVKIK